MVVLISEQYVSDPGGLQRCKCANLAALLSEELELIFLIVDGIMLCFGFRRKIMLIAH